jgi:ABC-type nitrate/sulfonate/bicarbonate transport system ATPase subunit
LSNLSDVVSRAGGSARLSVRIEAKVFRAQGGEPHTALRDVAFDLRAGETAALVGPSGCGKSTLMQIATGLDRDFRGGVTRDPRARMGVSFQEPRLLPWRSALDNVRIAAPRAREAEIEALFERFEVAGHRDHFPANFRSGSRAASRWRAPSQSNRISCCLTSLSPRWTRRCAGRCCAQAASLIAEAGCAALVITHDVDAAIALADVIYVLSHAPDRWSRACP